MTRAPQPTALREARRLEVLPGRDHSLDYRRRPLGLSAERFDIDDPPAFLARDLRPVVRVGRIRQVLVLFELLPHRPEEIVELDALGAGLDEALEGQSLRPAHHGFDPR